MVHVPRHHRFPAGCVVSLPLPFCLNGHGSAHHSGLCISPGEDGALGMWRWGRWGARRVMATLMGKNWCCWYGSIPINTIFRGLNIHLPAILMFTRGTRFWHTAMWWAADGERRWGDQPLGIHQWSPLGIFHNPWGISKWAMFDYGRVSKNHVVRLI